MCGGCPAAGMRPGGQTQDLILLPLSQDQFLPQARALSQTLWPAMSLHVPAASPTSWAVMALWPPLTPGLSRETQCRAPSPATEAPGTDRSADSSGQGQWVRASQESSTNNQITCVCLWPQQPPKTPGQVFIPFSHLLSSLLHSLKSISSRRHFQLLGLMSQNGPPAFTGLCGQRGSGCASQCFCSSAIPAGGLFPELGAEGCLSCFSGSGWLLQC